MVPDTSPKAIRKDTRGLPEDMDPRNFYEYRYLSNLKTATGLEGLLLQYIPVRIHKSVVFAIDPLRDFKVAPHRITPSNRNRKKGVASVLQQRMHFRTFTGISDSQTPNYGGISVCWSPSLAEHLEAHGALNSELSTQQVLHSEINDTTRRTRLLGSEQGTMDSFHGTLISGPRIVRKVDRYHYIYHPAEGIPSPECSERGGAANTRSESSDNWKSEIVPSAAVLYLNDYNNLRTAELAYLNELIAEKGLAMFKEWSPLKREYTLFRNVVELKDLPRSLKSIQETVRAFRSLFASLGTKPKLRDSIFEFRGLVSRVPDEYLSYHFGWKQLVRDVRDLLALPDKLSKKYAFLIRRAGKPTTFRTKRNLTSSKTDGVSGFDYDISPYEYSSSSVHRLERETELRLVINAVFDFPPPDDITFKSHRFWDQIGAVPRPTDIYNLVPWSWLLDWFTGLGNYVEVIDNISRDTSLINWGMITALTKGRLITNFESKSNAVDITTEDFIGRSEVTSVTKNSHESRLDYECRIRKDMATVLAVNTTAAPNLSGYQQSILGALLAQRMNHVTPRTFRPGSS